MDRGIGEREGFSTQATPVLRLQRARVGLGSAEFLVYRTELLRPRLTAFLAGLDSVVISAKRTQIG